MSGPVAPSPDTPYPDPPSRPDFAAIEREDDEAYADELARINPGEILVCESTSPNWTPAFAKIAACVCDGGGMLSHAAIVGREYRVPTVTAVGLATVAIADGDEIEVDGDEATATWYLQDRVIAADFNFMLIGAAFYHDSYRRTADGWRISGTGYQRTYDATMSLENLNFKLKLGAALNI